MKVSELFEASNLYHNGKFVYGSIADWLKDNNISQQEINDVVTQVKKSPEYKKLISLGLKEKSGATQLRRATFGFVHTTLGVNYATGEEYSNDLLYTAWPTGQLRVAPARGRGQTRLKSDPPKNFGENGMSNVEVMVSNLLAGFTRIASLVAKKEKFLVKTKELKEKSEWVPPKGIDIRFSKPEYRIISKKNDKFKFTGVDCAIEITFTDVNRFPDDYITWVNTSPYLSLSKSTGQISFDNLPDATHVNINLEEVDTNKLLKAFPSLTKLGIRRTGTVVNLVKIVKKDIMVDFYDVGLKQLDNFYYDLIKNKKIDNFDKALRLQEWLIDNNLEQYAK